MTRHIFPERRPGHGPDWAGILNNLTHSQLDALNAQATAIVLNPDDPERANYLPPREDSGDAQDPEEPNEPSGEDTDSDSTLTLTLIPPLK